MRMVFPAAPDEVFDPARDRLVASFERWARRHRRPVDPFVVDAVIEHRWATGDGLLCRWQPADLQTVLCSWFPRKVTLPPGEWDLVIPTVHAFVDYLFAEDLADVHCAKAHDLHAALDGLAAEFDTAMSDETHYGIAKFWSMRMLAAGVDPVDRHTAERYIENVRSGAIAVDQQVLDQVMENYLTATDDERPPPLPMVGLADDATLAESAAQAPALVRMLCLVDWVGAGRPLTATGRLRLADARELIALLNLPDVVDPQIGGRAHKTQSSDDLYELSVTFGWAKAARVVRVVKGRLLPVKLAAKLLTDPLALAHRAFETFFALREAVCGAGWTESMIAWRYDGATSGLVMGLYLAQEPVDVGELEEIAFRIVQESTFVDVNSAHADIWRRQCDNDVRRILKQLALLGAAELTGDRAELTPLGVALAAAHLRGLGYTVPTLESLLEETAEVVIAYAADAAPAVRDRLLAAWRDRHPDTARTQLRALAARTDDRVHRQLAEACMRTTKPSPTRHLHAVPSPRE